MWGVIAGLVTLTTAVLASDNSVHIYYSYPELRTTSSTLRWIGDKNGNRPDSAVIATYEIVPGEAERNAASVTEEAVQQRPVYVCRARHDGLWVPGLLRTDASECQVSLQGRVVSYPHYEVLENMETGARLSWAQWGRHSPVLPKGAVAGGESYVARRRVDMSAGPTLGLRHHVGHLDPKEGLGRVLVIEGTGKNAREQEYHEGEVLVESEPISYEVNSLKFMNKRRKEVRTLKQLGTAVLSNDQSESTVKVDSVIAYDNVLSMYWGQARAMLKGLATNIRLPNNNMEEIKWGIPYTEERKDVYRIEAMLEPGTAVNVTLRGNQTESEVPYSGKLVAVYEDLQTRARSISGQLTENSMRELRAEYGPVYWLHNSSLVPTTTSLSTTVVTTPTTTANPEDTERNISLASSPASSASSSLLHSSSIGFSSISSVLVSFVATVITKFTVVFANCTLTKEC